MRNGTREREEVSAKKCGEIAILCVPLGPSASRFRRSRAILLFQLFQPNQLWPIGVRGDYAGAANSLAVRWRHGPLGTEGFVVGLNAYLDVPSGRMILSSFSKPPAVRRCCQSTARLTLINVMPRLRRTIAIIFRDTPWGGVCTNRRRFRG